MTSAHTANAAYFRYVSCIVPPGNCCVLQLLELWPVKSGLSTLHMALIPGEWRMTVYQVKVSVFRAQVSARRQFGGDWGPVGSGSRAGMTGEGKGRSDGREGKAGASAFYLVVNVSPSMS